MRKRTPSLKSKITLFSLSFVIVLLIIELFFRYYCPMHYFNFFHESNKDLPGEQKADEVDWTESVRPSKLLGFETVHSANIYLTCDKIYMVEPQAGAFWEANPDEDTVFFIKM